MCKKKKKPTLNAHIDPVSVHGFLPARCVFILCLLLSNDKKIKCLYTCYYCSSGCICGNKLMCEFLSDAEQMFVDWMQPRVGIFMLIRLLTVEVELSESQCMVIFFSRMLVQSLKAK